MAPHSSTRATAPKMTSIPTATIHQMAVIPVIHHSLGEGTTYSQEGTGNSFGDFQGCSLTFELLARTGGGTGMYHKARGNRTRRLIITLDVHPARSIILSDPT